jgi:hypothetical protein
MGFGDIKLNLDFDLGVCRCHGRLSPVRTPNGDVAKVLHTEECLLQRLGIWLALSKGERPLFPYTGCCIREYVNKPLTKSNLYDLRANLYRELSDVFPELEIKKVEVTPIDRYSIQINAIIGDVDIVLAVSGQDLSVLQRALNKVMSDLHMTKTI